MLSEGDRCGIYLQSVFVQLSLLCFLHRTASSLLCTQYLLSFPAVTKKHRLQDLATLFNTYGMEYIDISAFAFPKTRLGIPNPHHKQQKCGAHSVYLPCWSGETSLITGRRSLLCTRLVEKFLGFLSPTSDGNYLKCWIMCDGCKTCPLPPSKQNDSRPGC